jgi:hypothetical protein
MFLLVVVLSVHVSFGRCIVCPCFFTKGNIDRQYNDQKKHGQTIQRPKETWTDNTTTKRNMERQYNDQKKHEQAIQRPKKTWTESMFLLVVVLPVHVSFGRCIASPCFFWSLYCLSMFLLVFVSPVYVSFGSQYNDQKKHGQAIQRPKETWTGNTTTKTNMDRQYNYQKKHGQTIQRHVSFGLCIACPCFFWSLYCLSRFLLVVVLSVHASFGRSIVCPCFFWSLFCLSMFLLVVVLPVQKHGQTIQRPKEAWTDNTTTKRNMDRQYNDQKKHRQTIQLPKET